MRQIAELESAPTCVLWEANRLHLACADGQWVTYEGSIVPDTTAKKSKPTTKGKEVASHNDLSNETDKSPKPSLETAAPNAATHSDGLSKAQEITLKEIGTSDMSEESGHGPKLSNETETIPKLSLDAASRVVDLSNNEDLDRSLSSPHQGKSPEIKPAALSDSLSVAGKNRDLASDSEALRDSAGDEFSDSSQGGHHPTVRSRYIDDEASDVDDGDGSVESNASQVHLPRVEAGASAASPIQRNDDDDDVVDDDYDDGFDHAMGTNYGATSSYEHQIVAQLPKPQPAFVPSSTPPDLQRRFLCWNYIGSIRRHDLDGRFSVQVDFTDMGFHRPISFTDNSGFTIASLGEDGGIFATDVANDDDDDDDDDNFDVVRGLSDRTKQAVKSSLGKKDSTKAAGSTLYFLRFKTFGNSREKDWFLTLPGGERALCCATGQGWVAVMTNRRFLRLFSPGGNQSHVFWLHGEPITMAGRSCFLAVFFHEGEPLRDGTQKIGYMLMDCSKNRIIAKGSTSCISSGATLKWVGFDKDCSLIAMDSEGMVSMLVCTDAESSWEWIPLLDTLGLRKSTEDCFWPVTVYDGKLVCIPLKGGAKHPDASKRPITTMLQFKLPLARGTFAKG